MRRRAHILSTSLTGSSSVAQIELKSRPCARSAASAKAGPAHIAEGKSRRDATRPLKRYLARY
jgi:hypothetical protein